MELSSIPAIGLSPPSSLPWRATSLVTALLVDDILEYPEERDGITTADLNAHRQRRAPAMLSQCSATLAPTTSVEFISYLSPEENREYGNRDCTYPK